MSEGEVRYAHELSGIEGLCWLASNDGGRVDLTRERSPRAQRKIDAALEVGAIDGNGWLTQTGWRIAEAETDDEAAPVPQKGRGDE